MTFIIAEFAPRYTFVTRHDTEFQSISAYI